MSTQNDELLTTKEAARYLRVSPRTLERYRVTGQGPRYLKIGRLVFYRKSDLDAWLAERERRSTSDPGPRTEGADPASTTGRRARRTCTVSHRVPETPTR